MKRAEQLLQQGAVQPMGVKDYDPIEGRFTEPYKRLDGCDYLLRADAPINRIADLVATFTPFLSVHYPFLDLGNGRALVGLETMTHDNWFRLADLSAEQGGHAFMEKAPGKFKKENDVFGRHRPEWNIMHRLKTILDPGNIFSPGRLPGNV